MKKSYTILLVFFSVLLLSSCASRKNIVYFQDEVSEGNRYTTVEFEPTIQKGDILKIDVTSGSDPQAAQPFNLMKPIIQGIGNSNNEINYLVDNNGNINFPILGEMHIEGQTRIQLTDALTEQLKAYLKAPIVNIRILNFKVTILGEVASPGTFKIENERVSIVEAIGMAGDMQILGKRKPVTLIREENGERKFIKFDFTDKNVFSSPYFYLAQNDIVYVEPNNTKVKSSLIGPNLSLVITSLSLLLSLGAVTGLF